jgi:hypothetical protein
MEAVQTNGTSLTEMQTKLHTVCILSTESLASKFVTIKTKNLVTHMMESSYE